MQLFEPVGRRSVLLCNQRCVQLLLEPLKTAANLLVFFFVVVVALCLLVCLFYAALF